MPATRAARDKRPTASGDSPSHRISRNARFSHGPRRFLLLSCCAITVACAPVLAGWSQEPGVFDDRVVFGQSAAFSGEAQELGINLRLGIEAAFEEARTAGGVHGRMPELLSLDDGYEPEAAIVNTRRLIEEEEVFALIGAVGTPTSRSATPVAAEAAVPYIAPFTGAEFLRDPQWTNIVNLRASYFQETESMVSHLTEDLGTERIAVFYQDDSFGQAGYEGVTRALARRGMEAVALTVFPRNTRAVKTGILELRNADPEALIIVGSYQPVAETIAWSRRIGFDPVFLTVSFVGSNALAQVLGPAGAGAIVTQVVPFPLDEELPVIRQYHAALRAHTPDAVPGFVSLEGYLAGRLALAALQSAGRELSRTSFLDALKATDRVDFGGFLVSFGDDNQGSDAVFLTVIDESGQYRALSSLDETAGP